MLYYVKELVVCHSSQLSLSDKKKFIPPRIIHQQTFYNLTLMKQTVGGDLDPEIPHRTLQQMVVPHRNISPQTIYYQTWSNHS